MKAANPNLHGLIKRNEERVENGETVDKVGRPIRFAEEDAPVELEPGDELARYLFAEVSGAIPPDGTYPIPSEEDHVLERLGVRHPENQRWCRETVRAMCAGRAEGLSTVFDKPKPQRKEKRRGS